jgi:hypothetical protein
MASTVNSHSVSDSTTTSKLEAIEIQHVSQYKCEREQHTKRAARAPAVLTSHGDDTEANWDVGNTNR